MSSDLAKRLRDMAKRRMESRDGDAAIESATRNGLPESDARNNESPAT